MSRDDQSLTDYVKSFVGRAALAGVVLAAAYLPLYIVGSAAQRSTGMDMWYVIDQPAWLDSAREGLEPLLTGVRDNRVYDRR